MLGVRSTVFVDCWKVESPVVRESGHGGPSGLDGADDEGIIDRR